MNMRFNEEIFCKITENLKREFKDKKVLAGIRKLIIDNSEKIENLKENATIGTLFKAMTLHDHSTGVHMKRVALLSYKLFNFLHDNKLNRHVLIQSALIHDIGKLVMPNSYLTTNLYGTEDFCIMTAGHVVAGEYISRICRLPEEISEMIALHHHHDGYPYERIPEGLPSILSKAEWVDEREKYADYIGILDTIEAMTSQDRKYYQKPLNLREVESIIKEQVKKAGIDDKTFSDFLKWFETTVK